MKKKFLAMLLLAVLLAMSMAQVVWAEVVNYAVTDGNIQFDTETGTIIGADGSVTEANIPDKIEGVEIISIADKAFSECGKLKKIIMPDSVTSIGWEAFGECTGLTEVRLSQNLTAIKEGAFRSCHNLKTISIPNSVLTIERYAFDRCAALESVTILNSVTSIGEGAFAHCESLTDVIIPNSVTELGDYAFISCTGLTKITLSKNITEIGEEVFRDCRGLVNVTIPENTKVIGSSAFAGCSSLKGVGISRSVSTISQDCFVECENLTNVYYAGTEEQWKQISIASGNDNLLSATIHYNSSNLEPLEEISYEINGVIYYYTINGEITGCKPGNETVLVVPAEINGIKITEIGSQFVGGVFIGCDNLTSVKIPNSVTEIGANTFFECRSLTNVDIPDSVVSMQIGVFTLCESLKSVKLPKGISSIQPSTFFECTNLKSVYIPAGVKSIFNTAFDGCANLTDVYYGGTEEQWNKIRFYNGIDEELQAATIHYNSSNPSEPEKPDKPETPQPGGEDEIVEEIPADGFGVMVTTADGKPLPGVKVELVNQFGMPEEVTDTNGLVRFYTMPTQMNGNDKATLNLTKEGYQSVSGRCAVAKGELLTFVMYPNDGKTHIIAVSGSFMGDTADLARDYLYFKSNAEGTNAAADNSNVEYLKIDVTATGNAPINKYQLLQDGKVVFESNIAKMEIPVYTGTPSEPYIFTGAERVSKLKAGQKVYLRVVDENGTASPQVQLAIKVSQPTTYNNSSSGGPGSISIGKKLKVKLPRNIPMFGGQEFEFGLDMLPFQFQVFEDGKVRFAINPSKDLFEAGSVDGTDIKAWDNIGKSYSQAVRDMTLGRWSAGVKFGGTPQGFSAGNFKCNANVLGYGEGYVDDYGNIVGEIKVIVSLSEKYNFSYPTFILEVPVYVAVRQEGTASGSGHINIDYTNGQFHFAGVGGELNLSFMLNPAVGLGVDNFISAEIGGRGTLSWLNRLADDYNKVDLVGDVYVEGKLFCLKKRVPFLDGTWTIYDSYAKKDKQQGQAMLASLYDADGYEPIDRTYLNQPMLLAAASEVVKANSYPNAMPSLVQVDETAYLFWLDDVASRADNDRTALVYATSRDMVNWSEPRQIVPETANSTADYMYDVCVEGGKIHIAMCKANQQFGTGEVGLNEMAASADVYYTNLDTDSMVIAPLQCVAGNSYANLIPKVVAADGQVVVAYAENQMENGIFGLGNTYQVVSASIVDGNVGRIVKTEANGLLNALNAGILDGQPAISYIVDVDRDYQTDADRELYLLTGGREVQLTNNDLAETAPKFAAIGGADSLLWYANGNIFYISSADGPVNTVFADNNAIGIGNNFYVINDDLGNARIVWTALPADENIDTMTVWATDYCNETWTGVYPLLETNSLMTSALSGYTVGDRSYIAYLCTKEISADSQLTDLCVNMAAPVMDIGLLAVDYDFEAVIPGAALPLKITVQNNGGLPVDNIAVDVDGESLTGISVADLDIGEIKTYEVVGFVVPSDLTGLQTVTAKVNVAGDVKESNNANDFKIGYTDISVTANRVLVNGSDWANIIVKNESAIPTDVTLTALANNAEGAVLFKRSFSALAKENAQTVLLPLAELETKGDVRAIYVVIAAEKEEVFHTNNTDLVYLRGSVSEKPEDNTNNSSGGGHRPTTKPSESKPGSTAETQKPIITGENINTVFADVQNNVWYSEAIAYVYNNGMMNGTEKGFEPNAATTRAMIVTMLHRLEKEPAAGVAGFADVAGGQWYSEAIAWAAVNGVVNGYSETKFAPNDEITREQLAAILYRYAQFKGLNVSAKGDLSGFADGAAVSDWAVEAMQWAVGAGLLNGNEQGRLAPTAGATRAEVAMMLMRFAETVK